MRTYKTDGSYRDGLYAVPEVILKGISVSKIEYAAIKITDFEMKRVNNQKMKHYTHLTLNYTRNQIWQLLKLLRK